MSTAAANAAGGRPARIRTRIAPSPTGFLHLGTARTALYSWAYARHHGGEFVLRIEDTDVARSSHESVEQILDAMAWLGLDYDEGPIHQTDRLDRYCEVVERMLAEGSAYRCWCTPEELDAMREAQRERGEKTHYDGRWRPEPGKALPPVPEGVTPVIRFRNPSDGSVEWDDLVKGSISIANGEIDDLIIVRADGIPTYNFAVVVDDIDMAISHVFRGDEHINNTPWQINIFEALKAPLPFFAHLPIILGDDGQKLSKRRGAVSVTAYRDAGYLPDGLLNYLARLGWSHGDKELFDRRQLVEWFDGSHLSKSPAQWDAAKLAWVNAHHLRSMPGAELAELVAAQLRSRGIDPIDLAALERGCGVFKDRCSTTVELADALEMLFVEPTAAPADADAVLAESVRPALRDFADQIAEIDWNRASIAAAIKQTLGTFRLKMPQFAPAVRVLVCGRRETPALDAVLELFSPEQVAERLRRGTL